MKRKYLKDMTSEELEQILKCNSKFEDMISRDIYDMNMICQEEDTKNILGENVWKYIKSDNNYNNFCLTIKDYKQFINNLDKDYLSIDNQKKYDDCMGLYTDITDLERIMYNYDLSDDEYNEKDKELDEKTEKFEKLCDSLLSDVEDYLHSYEEYPNDDEIRQYVEEYYWESDEYYIEIREDNTTDNVLRRDFTECYC